MTINHAIENDVIDLDHHQSNVIDIKDLDRAHVHAIVIAEINIVDILDHVHLEENDHDQDQEDIHHHHRDDVQIHELFIMNLV